MGYLILGIIILAAILIFRWIYSSVRYKCCNVDGRFHEMGR